MQQQSSRPVTHTTNKFQNRNLNNAIKVSKDKNNDYSTIGGLAVFRTRNNVGKAIGGATVAPTALVSAPIPLNTPSVKRENNGKDPLVNIISNRSNSIATLNTSSSYTGVWRHSNNDINCNSIDVDLPPPMNTSSDDTSNSFIAPISKPAPWAKPTTTSIDNVIVSTSINNSMGNESKSKEKIVSTSWAEIDSDEDDDIKYSNHRITSAATATYSMYEAQSSIVSDDRRQRSNPYNPDNHNINSFQENTSKQFSNHNNEQRYNNRLNNIEDEAQRGFPPRHNQPNNNPFTNPAITTLGYNHHSNSSSNSNTVNAVTTDGTENNRQYQNNYHQPPSSYRDGQYNNNRDRGYNQQQQQYYNETKDRYRSNNRNDNRFHTNEVQSTIEKDHYNNHNNNRNQQQSSYMKESRYRDTQEPSFNQEPSHHSIPANRYQREDESYPPSRRNDFPVRNRQHYDDNNNNNQSRNSFNDNLQRANAYQSSDPHNNNQYDSSNNNNRSKQYPPSNKDMNNQHHTNDIQNPRYDTGSSNWERVKLTNETPLPARIPPPTASLSNSNTTRNNSIYNQQTLNPRFTGSIPNSGPVIRLQTGEEGVSDSRWVSGRSNNLSTRDVANTTNKISSFSAASNTMDDNNRDQYLLQRIDSTNSAINNGSNNRNVPIVRSIIQPESTNTLDSSSSLNVMSSSQYDPNKPFASLFVKPSSSTSDVVQSNTVSDTNNHIELFSKSDFPLPETNVEFSIPFDTHTSTAFQQQQQLHNQNHNLREDINLRDVVEKQFQYEQTDRSNQPHNNNNNMANRMDSVKTKPKVLFDPESNAFKEFTDADRLLSSSANSKHPTKPFADGNTNRSKHTVSKEKDGKWSKQALTNTDTIDITSTISISNSSSKTILQPSAVLTRPKDKDGSNIKHDSTHNSQQHVNQKDREKSSEENIVNKDISLKVASGYVNERKELRRKERESRGPRTKGLLYRYNTDGIIERVLSEEEKLQSEEFRSKKFEDSNSNSRSKDKNISRKDNSSKDKRRSNKSSEKSISQHHNLLNQDHNNQDINSDSIQLFESNSLSYTGSAGKGSGELDIQKIAAEAEANRSLQPIKSFIPGVGLSKVPDQTKKELTSTFGGLMESSLDLNEENHSWFNDKDPDHTDKSNVTKTNTSNSRSIQRSKGRSSNARSDEKGSSFTNTIRGNNNRSRTDRPHTTMTKTSNTPVDSTNANGDNNERVQEKTFSDRPPRIRRDAPPRSSISQGQRQRASKDTMQ